MRRGMFTHLANTSAQMACGRQLGADVSRLAAHAPSEVHVDLLTGATHAGDGRELPPLHIGDVVHAWLGDRFRSDVAVRDVSGARLILRPVLAAGRLRVDCETVIDTARGRFTGADSAFWCGVVDP